MAGPRQDLSRRAAVVGVGTTPHGKHPGVSEEQLGVRAFKSALEDAAIEKGAIDGFLAGGKSYFDHVAAKQYAKTLGLEPRVSGGMDYGAGAAVVHYATQLIAAGICETVACVFANSPPQPMQTLVGVMTYEQADNQSAVLAAALGWSKHMARYGIAEDALGPIAVSARRHAQLNPEAAFRDPLTLEEYADQDFLIWPFRALDLCRMTAGAVALIFTSAERADSHPKPPVYVDAIGRYESARILENDDQFTCEGMRETAAQVYGSSGLTAQDVDVLGITDAFSGSVMYTLEHYGFCGPGESPDFVKEGNIDLGGSFPVNPDGGHLSCGWLSGWTHQAELVRQLRGECGDRQVPGAKVGQYCSEGRFLIDYLSTIYVAD